MTREVMAVLVFMVGCACFSCLIWINSSDDDVSPVLYEDRERAAVQEAVLRVAQRALEGESAPREEKRSARDASLYQQALWAPQPGSVVDELRRLRPDLRLVDYDPTIVGFTHCVYQVTDWDGRQVYEDVTIPELHGLFSKLITEWAQRQRLRAMLDLAWELGQEESIEAIKTRFGRSTEHVFSMLDAATGIDRHKRTQTGG